MSGDGAEFLAARTTFEVADVERSVEWYQAALGFVVETTMEEPPTFAILRRDAVGLGLSATPTPAVAAIATLYLEVADLDPVAALLEAAAAEIVIPPTTRPWGLRDLVVRDPDGHLVAIGARVE